MPPGAKVAIVACMDARLNPYGLLGLKEGDAHVIRNAGGVITADEIRSLAISQRLLGTEEIILIHHTDCGMLTFTDEDFKRSILEDTGIKPDWAAEGFATSTRTCASRSRASTPARSSPSRTCAASSTRSRTDACARCAEHAGWEPARNADQERPSARACLSPRRAMKPLASSSTVLFAGARKPFSVWGAYTESSSQPVYWRISRPISCGS